jgi:hypothetical protein
VSRAKVRGLARAALADGHDMFSGHKLTGRETHATDTAWLTMLGTLHNL